MNTRRLLILALAPVLAAALSFGGFRLQQEIVQSRDTSDCIPDTTKGSGEFLCPEQLPMPDVCEFDYETGLSAPGRQGCYYQPTGKYDPRYGDNQPVPFPPPPPINEAALLAAPPVHRVGDAKALGRNDCPAGWQAVVSDTTGVSVCFPADIGKLTDSGFQSPGGWEEALMINIPGDNEKPNLGIRVIRSAGTSGPYHTNCAQPEISLLLGLPAETCIWGESSPLNEDLDAGVGLYVVAHSIEKSGFQWVFEATIWDFKGKPSKDQSTLRATIAQIFATLQLP